MPEKSNADKNGGNTLHPIERFFSADHPISRFINGSFEGSKDGYVVVNLTAPEALIHQKQTGLLHSGFALIVLDSIMGGAAMGTPGARFPLATVNLSINDLRRPRAGERLKGEANCVSIYNDLAYIKAELVSLEKGDVIAIASGTFMIGTRASSIREKSKAKAPNGEQNRI